MTDKELELYLYKIVNKITNHYGIEAGEGDKWDLIMLELISIKP